MNQVDDDFFAICHICLVEKPYEETSKGTSSGLGRNRAGGFKSPLLAHRNGITTRWKWVIKEK